MFKTKSIYEHPEEEDGVRILISKEWPEKLSKQKVRCAYLTLFHFRVKK